VVVTKAKAKAEPKGDEYREDLTELAELLIGEAAAGQTKRPLDPSDYPGGG
jgi:hypothetical protein